MKTETQNQIILSTLEQFKKAYNSVNVTVYGDSLVYKVASGTAVKAAIEARKLAASRGLQVEITPTMLLSLNSFCVTPKTQN